MNLLEGLTESPIYFDVERSLIKSHTSSIEKKKRMNLLKLLIDVAELLKITFLNNTVCFIQ